MRFQIALGFLCFYILDLTASQDPKCVNKYVGDIYKIALNSPQQDEDMLAWKCDNKIIYKRRRGRVDPAAYVDGQGSLTLTNISKSMACTYQAEHHDTNGKSLKTHSERLCVFSRIPNPKLKVEFSPSGVATLQCGPQNLPEGITLTWFYNNIEMKKKTNPLTPQRRGRKDLYKCRLSNGLDSDRDSKEETVSCEVSDDKLICINKPVMLGVLAGAGFLLLVLTLSLVVICKNCGHQKWKHENEELSHLRNTSTDPQQLQQAARENRANIRTPGMNFNDYYDSEIGF